MYKGQFGRTEKPSRRLEPSPAAIHTESKNTSKLSGVARLCIGLSSFDTIARTYQLSVDHDVQTFANKSL